MTIPRSIAIRTSFSHHAAHSGYKQILNYTRPEIIMGKDEHDPSSLSGLRKKYQFLVEWDAKRYAAQHEVDLIHILYGEEYFRFMKRIAPHIPLVATFHQPPELLQREITIGDAQGRVAKWTHYLTRDRFQHLEAAIVMTDAQAKVMHEVMPQDKVHVIPLGAHISHLTERSTHIQVSVEPSRILTVGEWMRDWEFYFMVVEAAKEVHPDWKFVLINRKLAPHFQQKAREMSNVEYLEEVSDEELFTNYKSASVLFLPFKGAAGNNSLNEALAFGCPAVTNILNQKYEKHEEFISVFQHGQVEEAMTSCKMFMDYSPEKRTHIGKIAQESVSKYDWSAIAEKTIEVYRLAISDQV